MGNNSSEDAQIFNWKQVQSNRYINKLTNEIIDHQRVEFEHYMSQTDQSAQITAYRERLKINKINVVRLLYYSCANKRDRVCSDRENAVDVYIEGGLSIARSIASVNGCSCLCSQVTKGFEQLKNIYGPYQVSRDMVFQDNTGCIKVWLNQNPFRNSFKPVKQSIMILQIKQVLIKLQCNCNMFLEENLTFQNFKLKSQNYGHRVSKYDKQKVSRTVQQHQQISKLLVNSPRNTRSPFYYPPYVLQQKNITNQPFKPHNQENTKYYIKQDNLSRTQKVTFSNSNMNTPQHTKAETRKNHSDYLLIGSQNSTPKVKFSYENGSAKGTPPKGIYIQRPLSQMSTFSQKMNNFNFIDTSCSFLNSTGELTNHNKIPKKVIFVQDPLINFRSNHLEQRKTMETEPQTQERILKLLQSEYNTRDVTKPLQGQKKPRDSEGIQTPPFELPCHQKLMKISSAPQNHVQLLGLSEIQEPEHSSQVSFKPLDAFHKQMIYQNSYTDRSVNEEDRLDTPRARYQQPSSDKPRIEYKVPEKTKLLIQKYLSQKQSNKSSSDKSNKNIRQQFNNLPKKFGNMPQVLRQKGKDKSQHRGLMFEVDEQNSKQQTYENQNQNEVRENNLKQDRQSLKKQMQKIFNSDTAHQDQQETTIRKKVAQKRAIFADLKAEATKILDTKPN